MIKALIVEDDAPIALLIERIIKPYVTETKIVGTLKEAVAYAQINSPELITLDLRLPDADWKDTLASIPHLRTNPNVVLMVISGIKGEAGLREDSLASGADAFLPKDEKLWGGLLGTLGDTIQSITHPDKSTFYSTLLQKINAALEKTL